MNVPQFVLLLLALGSASNLHAQTSRSLHDASSPLQRPGPEFGNELKPDALKIGSTMDVAIAGEHLFAIGQGELRVLSNAREGKPVIIGKLWSRHYAADLGIARSRVHHLA